MLDNMAGHYLGYEINLGFILYHGKTVTSGFDLNNMLF